MAQEKTYEMQWDCQFCGTKKLLGKTHRFCPNCGAPQDPDARYFPSDDEKVAVEDHVLVGKDKICPACGGLNAGSANNCGACGAPLDSAEEARTATEGFTAQAVPTGGRNVAQEQFEREMAAAGVQVGAEEAQSGGGSRWLIIVGVVLLAVCGGAFFLFNQTSEATVLATGHSWEREIEIEEYQTVRGNNWEDLLPAGAYNTSCTLRERDTRRVPDGEECRTERRDNGDGTFTERQVCETVYRNEPVMDDWCTYAVDQWEYGRSVTTSGDSLRDTPVWGDVNLRCTGARLGCEREAGRNETYSVTFRDEDGKNFICELSQSQWENIPIESRWTIEMRSFVPGVVCSSLEAADG